jgi:hypothetical protein
MAKVVPSGVIQLPDFAQLDYNLKQQKRQEQLQFDDYLSRFGEIQGNYLAGDLEAVQGAYDNIESVMDKLAANPDDPSLRRELRNAYGNYSQLAGTAKFLADNNRQQRALYATNPDNFSLTSDEAMGMLDDDARTKRSSEQILGLAGSPLTLPLAYKYQLGSPTSVADEMFKDFSRIEKDYIKKDGSYDQDKITQWGNEWLAARYIDPEQKRNAVGYSALRQGKIGRNGKLTGREDLDRLDTPEFEPFREPLLNDYNNQTIGAFMAIVPKKGVSDYQLNQDALRLAAARNKSLQNNDFFNLTAGRYTLADRTFNPSTGETIRSEQKGRGFMFPIEDIPVKLADGSQIISFGKFGDDPYVVKLVKETRLNDRTGEKETVYTEKAGKATTTDKAALRRASNGLYDIYMENISYTGEAKKAQPDAKPAFGDLGLAREMALPETTSGGNEMMSSADIERAIPSPAPPPVLPETAFGIGEGYFLTPEQRLQREQERKSTKQGLIDAGIVNIIP